MTLAPAGTQRRIDRVVLVDDEPKILTALQRLLLQEGYEIKTFSSAAAALEGMATELPDCVISDYYMPAMDGLAFLGEVRRRWPAVGRVLLTGGDLDPGVHRALQAELVQVLITKPWNLQSIRETMESLKSNQTRVFAQRAPCKPPEEAVAPTTAPPVPKPQHRPTLLVVDDDEQFRKMCDRWFTHLGYEAILADSAAEALRLGEEFPPEVLLTDLILPDVDGIELIRQFGQRYPSIPIVAFSGSRDRDLAARAFRQGACALLQKPLEPEATELTLRRCLEMNSLFWKADCGLEVSSLIELQRAINTGAPEPQLLELLLQLMLRYTQADSASLLVREEGDTLRIAAGYGIEPDLLNKRVEAGQRVAGWVVEHNLPQIIIGQNSDDPRLAGVKRNTPASLGVCLPLRGRERVGGCLCLTHFGPQKSFTREAIELGLLLGGEVAQALERAAASQRQVEAERDLLRLDKLVTIGELAAGVAHEINNPLGYVNSNLFTLRGYMKDLVEVLEPLSKAATPQDIEAVLAKAKQADLAFLVTDIPTCLRETAEGVERILRIVADLKLFSRSDDAKREQGDLNVILDGAISLLWNQIKHKGELIKEYEPIEPFPCFPSKLGQVFINLIHNAIQAIEKKGRIIVRTRRQGDLAVVEVEDNGHGFDAETGHQLFKPFFTTKPKGVGTGLGLSIAKKIITLHGGTMDFSSEIGKGSKFCVTIPMS